MQFVIVDNECKFIIDKRIYNIPTIMKAAYMYIDENYLFFDVLSENEIQVTITPKSTNCYLEKIAKEFCNELLAQSVRYNIFNDTKNVREIILGRALYSTCIENNDSELDTILPTSTDTDMEEFDEIAKNWFDNEGND